MSCEHPRVHASLRIARDEDWPGSEPRVVQGKTFHVAPTAVVDERDIRKLTIYESMGQRHVDVELKPPARRRLEEVTRANLGRYAFIEAAGSVNVPVIQASASIFHFDLGDERLSEICR
jgi:hypothetical protein